MIMENNTEVPSPFVTAKQLNSFLHKPVIVAGKVENVNEATLTIDGGDQGKVSVVRSKPAQAMIEPGMNVLIRGFVNQDLTVAESKNFPATDLGENFGMLPAFSRMYETRELRARLLASRLTSYLVTRNVEFCFVAAHMPRHETVQ